MPALHLELPCDRRRGGGAPSAPRTRIRARMADAPSSVSLRAASVHFAPPAPRAAPSHPSRPGFPSRSRMYCLSADGGSTRSPVAPVFDRRGGGSRSTASSAAAEPDVRRAAPAAAAPTRPPPSICATGWTVHDVHWAGVRFGASPQPVRPLPRRTRSGSSRSKAPTTTPSGRSAAPSRGDARARHGRRAALPATRLARAGRYPRDVRRQGRQVAHPDGARARQPLGFWQHHRLRPGRVGRPSNGHAWPSLASLRPHRARPALGTRRCVHSPARYRALLVPSVTLQSSSDVDRWSNRSTSTPQSPGRSRCS